MRRTLVGFQGSRRKLTKTKTRLKGNDEFISAKENQTYVYKNSTTFLPVVESHSELN